jgi:uncharacterized tellurite resistance protein B-like protein
MGFELEPSDLASLDDAQRLAVLETMVLGLIADSQVTPAEIRRFDEIVLALPWGVEREVLAGMIQGARDRLVALRTPAQIQDYLITVAERLPGAELRDKVVFTMATLMLSDGVLDRIEKNILGIFSVAFGITSERVAAIQRALHVAPAPAPPPPSDAN